MVFGIGIRRTLLLALCAAIVVCPVCACAQETPPSFSTPEDAITHFVSALAQNDLEKALEACAIDEYAAGFNFEGSVDRMKTMMPIQQMAPSEYSLYADINRIAAMSAIVNQTKMMVYSFFRPEVKDGTPILAGGTLEDAAGFAKDVDPGKLKDLKILRIDPPVKTILESEKNIANFTKVAELDGAQELTERIVLYELNGKLYIGGFGVLRYGEEWKILHLNSILAGQSYLGAVVETTMDQYASLL